MKKAKYVCKKCGTRFTVDIFEPSEVEATRRPSAPVRCPECRGPVERI